MDFANQGDQTNGVCGQCHNPSLIAPDAKAHASPTYGTTVHCTQCHNPHYQRQSRFYKDLSYLAVGSLSTDIDAVQPTTLKLSAPLPAPPQGSSSWVGCLILPDKRYTTFIYRIAAYDPGTATIAIDTGKNGLEKINTAYILPGAGYAVVYGRLVKDSIWSRAVRFFKPGGANSFADGDTTYDGMCEVCHTVTAHFRKNGLAPDQLHTSLGSSAAGTVCTVCHGHTAGFEGTNAGCLGCHEGSVGGRAAVGSGFRASSHHIQGVNVTNAHCYQCHWEANDDGTINTTYHSGSSAPGSAVDLVIYGAGARPAAYSVGTTAVQYTADGSRAEIQKINSHCIGCHSDQNNATQPFGDGKTPKQYAWDGTSIATRYSQTGTTSWGKYTGANITPKNTVTKAYSAHGNAVNNQGGWDLNETWPNTRNGSVNILCFDCHNSHGSATSGVTASYASATVDGGILKVTSAGQGGYQTTYAPMAGGSTNTKNLRNAGASLCLDCHLNADGGAVQPWGYQTTFGASQQIIGYWDTPYFGPGTFGSQQRYPYKSLSSHKGGHFGAYASVPAATGTINGLCTPCHDPHGVTNNTAKIPALDKPYAVPLLKGTWLTSPYKEDAAPAANTAKTINAVNAGNVYHLDQNTFGPTIRDTVTGITQSDTQFAGLCLTCHPKSSLTDGSNGGSWKSVDRIHESVKDWGANTKHKYSCSKCHTPHNSRLPRLMTTNCLNSNHKGRMGMNVSPVLSGYSYGLHEFSFEPVGPPSGGDGGGEFPGSWDGDIYGDYTVTCHEGQSADQSWNDRTAWLNMPPTTPVLVDEPDSSSTGIQLQWSASNDPEGNAIQYKVQVDDASNFASPNYTSAWTSGTSYSITVGSNTTWYWRVKAKDATSESAWSTTDSFNVSDGIAPPQVTLSNPASGVYYTYPQSVTLQWSAVPPLAEYRLEVDNESGFTAPLVYDSGWITTTNQLVSITAAGTYYWRVQARDPLSFATGAVSAARTFIANKPPSRPTLIYEPDTSSTDIDLQWNASTDSEGDAIQYQVQVDDASNFSSPNYTSAWISGTSYSITVGSNTTWYWRVKARDSLSESIWSVYDAFIVSDGIAPPQVTLSSPSSGTVYYNIPVNVTFQWGAVPDFAQYRLEVDNESGFSAPLVYDSGWTNAMSRAVNITTAGTYYWRVQARDTVSGATGPVSAVWTVIVNGPPTVPALIAEPDTTSPSIQVQWNASTDLEGNTPITYYMQVDSDPNFGSPDFVMDWSTATSYSFTGSYNVWYWRVKARDSLNLESAWSTVDRFDLYDDTAVPNAPALAWPPNGYNDQVGYPPGTNPLQWYAASGATEYYIEWWGGQAGNSGWISALSLNPGDLPDNYTYYWHVKARNGNGESGWSATRSWFDYWAGSCPFVFVWNGEKYEYITDIQGAPIGYAPSSYLAKFVPYFRPQYIVLDTLAPNAQEKYDIKLRETLPEITYFDEAKLLAVDYPAGYELVSSTAEMTYRFHYANPFTLYTIKDPRAPVAATDKNGTDVLAAVLETDGNLLPMELFALDSYTFDFGPVKAANAKLIIDGWSLFGSAYATPLEKVQPFIEVVDVNGQWVKVKSFGQPAGDMKRMAIDLSGLFLSSDKRIRLNTGRDSGTAWKIDRVMIDDSPSVEVTIRELTADYADLHHRGKATYSSANLERRLTAEDDVLPDNVKAYGYGRFTKYGDVRALLASTDDKYTIMRHGDEISLTFSAPSDPIPEGMIRTYVLKADVYYKVFRVENNVEPLPFHGMSIYPYDPVVEHYPDDAEHKQYLQEYNTRVY